MLEKKCPCNSGKLYTQCCKKFHCGINNASALDLMRSRYSAYALGLNNYIISSTHPDNPFFIEDILEWKKELDEFSHNTNFINLKILDHKYKDGENFAQVTFRATLEQNQKEISFTECSQFKKEANRWFYLDGVIQG